jgi:hypothetical protein
MRPVNVLQCASKNVFANSVQLKKKKIIYYFLLFYTDVPEFHLRNGDMSKEVAQSALKKLKCLGASNSKAAAADLFST